MKDQFEGEHGRARLIEALSDQRIVRHDAGVATQLAEAGALLDIKPGEVVARQGEAGTDFFFIVEGSFDILVKGNQVGSRNYGDHVGEIAALDPGQKRSATVRATEPSVVLKVPGEAVRDLGRRFPMLLEGIAIEANKRLAQRNDREAERNEFPQVLVISAKEALPVVRELESLLRDDDIRYRPWDQAGIFGISSYPIPSLDQALHEVDFALVVATPEDRTHSRGRAHPTPRDNVTFEMGMAIGHLGLDRTIIVTPSTETKLGTDLNGVNVLRFRTDRELTDALRPWPTTSVNILASAARAADSRIKEQPMTWETNKSLERIRRFKANVPETGIELEDFAGEYLPRRTKLAQAHLLTEGTTVQIVDIPRNRAILTDGVHVYADLMDFNEQLTSETETQASFGRALQFLHLHYGSCDRLIRAFGLQRVDFHGSRLHAVVLTPTGDERESERIARALAFGRAFIAMVHRTNAHFDGRYSTRVSVGVDSGKAIAINSGRGREHEPLFIGSPANHAAHLAACGVEGVHVSARVRQTLAGIGGGQAVPINPIEEMARRGLAAKTFDGRRSFGEVVEEELRAFDAELGSTNHADLLPNFIFHHQQPPLKSIDFEAIPPSNTILMPMAAVFADLDGFTAYVDQGLATGSARQVVSNLHVIRGEMAATIREDFSGRKVRFIGDCLQAVLAEGDARSTNSQASIDQAVLAAGGLRSSFDLCRSELPGIANLGLAIGIEFGMTPACRIGLRGEGSVRCVTSAATCGSERVQQECAGAETGMGQAAIDAAGFRVRQTFRLSNIVPNLNYPEAVALVRGLPSVQANNSSAPAVKAHAR